MLPDLMNGNDVFKSGIRAVNHNEDLSPLKTWLQQRISTTGRETLPAWAEVLTAILTLIEVRLEEKENPTLFFETHIIARQVRRQRNDEKIQTRFVTDEMGRLNKHLSDYIESSSTLTEGSNTSVVVIGWCLDNDKRGIGVGVTDSRTAAMLFSGDLDRPILGLHISRLKKFTNSLTQGMANSTLSLLLITVILMLGTYIFQTHWKKSSGVIENILQEKYLRCGVDGSLRHFSMFNDAEQTWWGIDVEMCKAIATGIGVKPYFYKVDNSRFDLRLETIEKRDLHILFRNTSHTVTRDLKEGFYFGPYYFYEREYFLDLVGPKSNKPVTDKELFGKRVCVKPGSSNEATLKSIADGIELKLIVKGVDGREFNNNFQLLKLLRESAEPICDYVFGNYYVLKQLNSDQQVRNNFSFPMRSYTNSRLDPLAAVLPRDEAWREVVSYIIYVLIQADEMNINSYNVDHIKVNGSKRQKDFLKGIGMQSLNLPENWVYNLLSTSGSYDEIYYRSFACDYADCPKPAQSDWDQKLRQLNNQRWPNYAFDESDDKPGLLFTPTF
ncbi:MAG: transporter substrate-binding domain-containing protein [Cellvibrionaceae bacterium]